MIVRGNALHLPIADESVDLIVTSPPYWALRSYQDAGAHYGGQLGSEDTPQAFLDNLQAVMGEAWRVLKPTGSCFVNLGDKYAGSGGGNDNTGLGFSRGDQGKSADNRGNPRRYNQHRGTSRAKSLMGLPWRFANQCVDNGWILRRDIIWHKLNGLPESVTDRCRSSHEYVFHFTKEGCYYSAIDEIRDPSSGYHRGPVTIAEIPGQRKRAMLHTSNPLGKLPGSVWSLPSEPLIIPEWAREQFDLPDHFAAYPTELVRRIVLGWSPGAICTVCGEGRSPVVAIDNEPYRPNGSTTGRPKRQDASFSKPHGQDLPGYPQTKQWATIIGYACFCTPFTRHAGTGESSPTAKANGRQGDRPVDIAANHRPVGPWTEYHFDRSKSAPVSPAIVLDPFGGTGTTSLVAEALGRKGISLDLSADYSRLAKWRCSQPATKVMSRTWKSRQGVLA